MERCLKIGLALAALCGTSTLVHARPPTVMNSPGYDARLQESRKALSNSDTANVPTPTVTPKRAKRKRAN